MISTLIPILVIVMAFGFLGAAIAAPDRTLIWVNRVRLAHGYAALDQIFAGQPRKAHECPLAASLPSEASVTWLGITWRTPYRLFDRQTAKAWKATGRKDQWGFRVRHHPSTFIFVLLFDLGFYPSYRRK